MYEDDSICITVPGSTANLGPGFDSIGLAVNKYLSLKVSRSKESSITTSSELLLEMERGEENLIYQVYSGICKDYGVTVEPLHIDVQSDIPLSRGLGSSGSAIIAGIELANTIGKLSLSNEQKLISALKWENHLDNIAASLYGGLVITTFVKGVPVVVKSDCSTVDIVAIIPSYSVSTKDARSVLPASLPFMDAIQGSAHSNVLVAALLKGDWDLAGKVMKKDLFHQGYRAPLVNKWETLEDYSSKNKNVYGMTLSGAGPTVLLFVQEGFGEGVVQELSYLHCKVELLQVETSGSRINILETCNGDRCSQS
ncbi:homoserine kinase [Bacillus salitolerans]|uniref:Homoserine kinase n=1 Tax=Bacillus salitolerans TaxID=1437434 RepID=A0ABW4LRK2_9BACI